jgi:hypothetical protein
MWKIIPELCSKKNVEDNSGIVFQQKMWKIIPESSSNKNLLYSMYF